MFFILGPLRTQGKYRVPGEGGILILANHISDCDPVIVQLACPRPVRFMAKSELWEMPLVRKVLTWWKGFPVKRGEPDRGAIKHAVSLLKRGETVCIFPEGQLSETGELQELKPGIALIIRMAAVPVICLGIEHSNRVIPYGSTVPRPAFHSVWARWGDPHFFGKDSETEEILSWAEGQLRILKNEPVD